MSGWDKFKWFLIGNVFNGILQGLYQYLGWIQ